MDYAVCACGHYREQHVPEAQYSGGECAMNCPCTVFIACSDARTLSGPPETLRPLEES